MTRNPSNSTPRTLRDCTFQSWADPIERPDVATPLVVMLYVCILCVAAVGVTVWRFA